MILVLSKKPSAGILLLFGVVGYWIAGMFIFGLEIAILRSEKYKRLVQDALV